MKDLNVENKIIPSYEQDIIAENGDILYTCYRIHLYKKCALIYDMRYINNKFTPLTLTTFEFFKRGLETGLAIGRVWIDETDAWNVDNFYKEDQIGSILTNKCISLLRG